MSQAEAVTGETFDAKVLKNAKTVLVDFWAEWCPPCRAMGPVLDQVAAARADTLVVCKVNCEGNDDLAAQYDVSNIPCFLLFRDGKVVDRRVGGCPQADMLAWVDKHLA